MSISAYASSLTIPPYPGPIARNSEQKPTPGEAGRNDTAARQQTERSSSAVPSTGLLNTVV